MAANKEQALSLLSMYLNSSVVAMLVESVTPEQFTAWFKDLQTFVESAWGVEVRKIVLLEERPSSVHV